MRRMSFNQDYDGMSPEQQVDYVVEHWEEIWTPVNAEVLYSISLDDREWLDIVIIEPTVEGVTGTEYEKYIPEIVIGYSSFKYL